MDPISALQYGLPGLAALLAGSAFLVLKNKTAPNKNTVSAVRFLAICNLVLFALAGAFNIAETIFAKNRADGEIAKLTEKHNKEVERLTRELDGAARQQNDQLQRKVAELADVSSQLIQSQKREALLDQLLAVIQAMRQMSKIDPIQIIPIIQEDYADLKDYREKLADISTLTRQLADIQASLRTAETELLRIGVAVDMTAAPAGDTKGLFDRVVWTIKATNQVVSELRARNGQLEPLIEKENQARLRVAQLETSITALQDEIKKRDMELQKLRRDTILSLTSTEAARLLSEKPAASDLFNFCAGRPGTAGAEGMPGSDGMTGQTGETGDNGEAGTNGQPGTSGARGSNGGDAAAEVVISITEIPVQDGESIAKLEIESSRGNRLAYIALRDPMVINCSGGAGGSGGTGGRGGSGGSGGAGGRGRAGSMAFATPAELDGGTGGDGGNGGPGGVGGAGGDGGRGSDVSIHVKGSSRFAANARRLLSVIVAGGNAGVGGSGGPGGLHGDPGPGGRPGTFFNGTMWRGEPGEPGKPGSDGRRGNDGAPGRKGEAGKLSWPEAPSPSSH